MDVLYLFYGLAFLALGFVVVIRREPDSALDLSGLLWPLAAFGFVHGFLEWTDLWRVVRGDPPWLTVVRPFILLASFLLLFEFGRRLVLRSLSGRARQSRGARLLGAWIHAPMAAVLAAAVVASAHPLVGLAVWSRHLPGFLGSCLAGVGCYLYRRQRLAAAEETSASVSLAWNIAAAAFLAYGIFGGLIVTDADFPGGLLSEETFKSTTTVPVQWFRAVCAVLVAASFGRIMGMFVDERRSRLRYAVDAGQYSLAQFQESKARYEAILNAVSEGVVGLDGEGKVSFINGNALATLGYAVGELEGKSFHATVHHTTAAGKPHLAEDCPIHRTLRDGELRRVDSDLFWRSNRTWFPVAYQVVPLRRGATTFGAVVLLRNLAGHA